MGMPFSLEGDERGVIGFDGDNAGATLLGGTAGVLGLRGEGEAGDSGRRKGEARGEPKESGEGLYGGRS